VLSIRRSSAIFMKLLLEQLTLRISAQTTSMFDESIFETDGGARAMPIGAIGEVDDIMHPGQGGM
jgi:hypothetical protein